MSAERPQPDEPEARPAAALDDTALIELMSDAVIVIDTAGRVLRWNRCAHEMYGWSSDEIIGQPVRNFIPNEIYITDDAAIAESTMLKEGRWVGLIIHRTHDDREIVVEVAAHLMRDPQGTAIGVISVMRDVGSRMRVDDQITMQSRMLTTVSDALVMVDNNTQITYWNSAAALQYGIPASDAIGMKLSAAYEVVWENKEDHTASLVAIGRDGRWDGRVKQITRAGKELYVEASVSLVRNVRNESIGMLAVLHDVTLRVRAEQRLALLADVSRTFAAASLDLDMVLQTVARRMAEVTGDGCIIRLLADDRVSLNLVALEHQDPVIAAAVRMVVPAVSRIDEGVHQQSLNSEPSLLVQFADADSRRAQMQRPYSAIFDTIEQYSLLIVPLRARGQIIGSITLFRVRSDSPIQPEEQSLAEDLADRAALAIDSARTFHSAERNLALLDTVLATAPVGIAFWDTNLRCVRINEAMANIDRLPVVQVQGQLITAITSPFIRALAPLIERVLHSGEPIIDHEIAEPIDEIIQRRTWMCSVYATRDSRGQMMGVGAVGVEITARKLLEAQLLQSQKMESIGRLAGGIAHDFNNLLTAISGYSELVLSELDPAGPTAEDTREIQRAASRATNLTRQLLAFARKQIIALQLADLNQLISETSRMISRLIGEDIVLTTQFAPKLDAIRIDTGQIEQVLVNLAINARDAMPGGGRLTIETANVYLSRSQLSDHTGIVEGHYVLFSVADTGIGMDRATRAQAFEPFFTTKLVGTGTGLGLSTCYGIIKQHGGDIWLYSEIGRGTIVRVYLPRADVMTDAIAAPMPVQAVRHGHETILLAEDEDLVRQLAARILRGLGYTVLEANSGLEAVRIAQSYLPQPIDLLLTDMVMPDLGGGQLAEVIVQLFPTIKIIYTSGYTDQMIVHDGMLAAGVEFLQKPFTSAALAARIRTTLDN